MKSLLLTIVFLLSLSVTFSQLGDKSSNYLTIEGRLDKGVDKFTHIYIIDHRTSDTLHVKAKKTYMLIIPCSKDYTVLFTNSVYTKELHVKTSYYIAKEYTKYLDINWGSEVNEVSCNYRKGNYRFTFPKKV